MTKNIKNKQNNVGKKLSVGKDGQLEFLFSELDKIVAKRDKVVTVRLTEKEHTTLKAKAKVDGSTLTDFVVKAFEAYKVSGFADIEKQIDEIYK